MTSHMCVGPTCWICGEPTELREMRNAMRGEFLKHRPDGVTINQCWAFSNLGAKAIREDVIEMMTKIVTLENELWLAKRALEENTK